MIYICVILKIPGQPFFRKSDFGNSNLMERDTG
jgi:hypothetical protein